MNEGEGDFTDTMAIGIGLDHRRAFSLTRKGVERVPVGRQPVQINPCHQASIRPDHSKRSGRLSSAT